jgi:PBP1b-binding outer membrane lipoprotein LpoB
MKQKVNHIVILRLTLLVFLITACNTQTKNRANKKNRNEFSETKKSDFELADEFLLKLKTEKADTIIFYNRTCIDCCDFFNIFWSNNGQRHLTKFYFDFDDMKSNSKTIELKADTIFNFLSSNFTALKNSIINGNEHKRKDGTTISKMTDHYCYAQLKIYTYKDSIITNIIKDHDFDRYTDFDFDSAINKGKRDANDSYGENISSKWNLFLISIENQIASMPETKNKEMEALRKRKSDK